jgi:hypothetical protein
MTDKGGGPQAPTKKPAFGLRAPPAGERELEVGPERRVVAGEEPARGLVRRASGADLVHGDTDRSGSAGSSERDLDPPGEGSVAWRRGSIALELGARLAAAAAHDAPVDGARLVERGHDASGQIDACGPQPYRGEPSR